MAPNAAIGADAQTAADVNAQAAVDANVEMLRQIILEQRRQVQAQNEILGHQQLRLEALERQLNQLSTPQIRPAVYPATPADRYIVPPRRAVDRAAGQGRAPQTAQAQRPDQPPPKRKGADVLTEAISERAGAGVFGKKGQFIIEPAISYSHNALSRVSIQGFTVIPAITIGSIDVREVERDTLVASLTGRYNITKNLQIDAKVPYVRREDTTTTRPLGAGASSDIQVDVSGSDIGDVEGGIHYQMTDGTGSLPILVANARVKSRTGTDPFEIAIFPTGNPAAGLEAELPTGSGFWSVEPSLTAIIPSDPVVFFSNVGYQYNMPRDITSPNVNGGVTTEIDPGDALKFGMGFGFGINERSSFSLGYDHAFVFASEQGGMEIFDSSLQVGTFTAGVAYKVSDSVNLNLSVGVGVTDTAPDVEMLLRLPIKLN